MRDLAGKTAVVTGGGSGIGRGTALALAEARMNIVIADIDEESASRVRDEIIAGGGRAISFRTDVTDKSSVDALADAAWSEFSAVHVLHNNAGIAIFVPLEGMSDSDWQWTIDVNLRGVVNGIQAFLPRLKAQEDEKHIVNTGSIAGLVGLKTLGAYGATKFAVMCISEVLRQEVADYGIGVSVLCPGFVSTNIVANAMERRSPGGDEMDFSIFSSVDPSMSRLISPEEVGRIVRRGIEEDEPYIFTHPEWEPLVRERFEALFASFARQTERAR